MKRPTEGTAAAGARPGEPSGEASGEPASELTAALETSSRRPSVAVALGTRRLSHGLDGERAHASDLLPALERLLNELDARPRDLARVYVGTGPGSYTGLRVGVATAFGLHRGCGAALLGVPSLGVLAFEALAPGERGALLLDARQGAYYAAIYERTDEGVVAERPPSAVARDALAAYLPAGLPLFVDASTAKTFEWSDEQRARLVVDRAPTASALLELGDVEFRHRGPTPPAELAPLYLRPFEARKRAR